MAALNFPTTNLVAGVTEYSANGTTYLWDGVKWVGRTAGGAAGTNSIQNNGNTVQVNADGDLVLPAYSLPNTAGTEAQVLTWPAGGTVLEWTDQSGGSTYTLPSATANQLGGVKLGEGFVLNGSDQVTTSKLYSTNLSDPNQHYRLELTTGGTIKLPDQSEIIGSTLKGIYGTGELNYTGITIGPTAQNSEESWMYVDHNGAYIATQYNTDQKLWTFGNDGTLTMPLETKLNSGGIGVPNSAEVGTTVAFDGPDIVNSEVFMGSGYGEFRSIYNKTSPLESGLVYAGVEGFNYANYGDVNFAGMVSQTPNIDSMYSVKLDDQGQIVLGFTQAGQTQESTDWSVAVGSLNTNMTVNGLFANTSVTAIATGEWSWKFDNTGNLATPYGSLTLDSGYETGTAGFIAPSGGVALASTMLYNSGNIASQILQNREGSGGTVQISAYQDAADPAATWTFGNTGNLTLPLGGNILNNDGSVYGGGGGNANTGDITFDGNQIGVDGNNGEIKIRSADGNDYSYAWQTPRRWEAYAENDEDGDHMAWAWIKADMEDGINNPKVFIETVAGNTGVEQRWTFGADGNLQLPQGSTISDQATSVDLTVGRVSESAYWYNLFGDTGATVSANVAINGSVVHDAGGNVYVLGSTTGVNFNNNNNLFLKYSPEGNLLWRRTWTDNDGLSCGSYNASLRYIEANVDLGTQDTILWAAQTPNNNISYVGTMDMEGNMVDQFGDARLPARLDNFAVTDLEWATDIGVPYVVVVGQLHVDGTGYNYPTFAGVDLDTAEIIGDITVVPAGTDLTAGLFSGPPWANSFKALTVLPPVGPNPSISAVVGSYYDGSHTHAMVTLSSGPETLTVGIGVDNHGSDDVIGEDICCDANGNVYVIVNNISSNYAVVLCGTAGSIESGSALWQRRIGDLSGSDSFYATAVAYDNGYVYVLGQFYQDSIGDTDVMLIKLNKYTGNIVWSRRIHSAGDDGLNFVGEPGWESSSGIHVQDGLIVISFATEAQTKDLNQYDPDLNTVTLQYPQDGSLLGTFGDFEITDFEPAIGGIDYSITTLTTTGGEISFTTGFATLQATTAAVGTGWTNTQWDMDQNREVYPTQTFKFMTDGTFDTPEIKHTSTVKITANTVSGTNASTWTFQNNDGLRFPDGSVQYGAYVQTEMSMDGGSAATVYNIISVPPVADGGGSASRFGNYDPVYDGSNGDNYVLDGGGA